MKNERDGTIERIGKIERTEKVLYGIWLAMLGIVLAVCSLERSPVLIGGTVRTLCFVLFGMSVILCLMMLVCGVFQWLSDQTGEMRSNLPDFRGRLLRLAAFAIAALLYWVYCYRLDEMIATNTTMDALVAGGLLCAAAVTSDNCKNLRRCSFG